MRSDQKTEPQVKKHLTAEERAMRRAEMARRRKNLSEKRNEEEKVSSGNLLIPLIEVCNSIANENNRWTQSTDC